MYRKIRILVGTEPHILSILREGVGGVAIPHSNVTLTEELTFKKVYPYVQIFSGNTIFLLSKTLLSNSFTITLYYGIKYLLDVTRRTFNHKRLGHSSAKC